MLRFVSLVGRGSCSALSPRSFELRPAAQWFDQLSPVKECFSRIDR